MRARALVKGGKFGESFSRSGTYPANLGLRERMGMAETGDGGPGLLGLLTSRTSEPLFWTPRLLDQPSGWWGHIPFASWLVCALKPRRLVELGAYRGVSYAAFCEAVLKCGLDTKCWAVDSWRGDEHVGFYDDEIYESFKSFHDSHYGAFSRLMRMQFDEACGAFDDGAVDLLHIDGYHTYAAVRRDFESWRPKLSQRAIVLFHDTNNDLKPDVNVKQFFSELGQSFPTFEFLHSYGLGVAAVGPEIAEPLKELFAAMDFERASMLRERFAHLGARWEKAEIAEQLREGARYRESLLREIDRKDAELRAAAEFNLQRMQIAQQSYDTLIEFVKEKDAQLERAQKAYDALKKAYDARDAEGHK
jgi:hypothetical protein